MNEPTTVELVAKALHLHAIEEGEVDADIPVNDYADAARAVVAAVQPLMEAAAIRAFADDLDLARMQVGMTKVPSGPSSEFVTWAVNALRVRADQIDKGETNE